MFKLSSRLTPRVSAYGFTLVELLVVISIIALLVAMLLPALGKARDQAMLTKCSMQTRGVAIASASYAADFKSGLPPNFNICPSNGQLYQESKEVNSYWWYRVGSGIVRGAYLWPNYIPDSEMFYCPTAEGFATDPTWQSYHHNWATAGVGTNTGVIAAQVSYAYPAAAYEVVRTNNLYNWNGVPGEYWATPGGYGGSYYWWKDSMLEPKIENNVSATPITWDLPAGSGGAFVQHKGEAATIAYIDGSAIQFNKVKYLNDKLTGFGVIGLGFGMSEYRIMPTLRKYREEGTLP